MGIQVIKSEKHDTPQLKFSRLTETEYLIVSKDFDTPKTGPSKFGGEWYLFGLTLHEYGQTETDTLKAYQGKDVGQVVYLASDDVDKEEWKEFQNGEREFEDVTIKQGTVLKELLKVPTEEKIKISMYTNDKSQRLYRVEKQDTPQDTPQVDSAVEKTIRDLKAAQQPVEQIVKIIQASHDLTEGEVEEIYNRV